MARMVRELPTPSLVYKAITKGLHYRVRECRRASPKEGMRQAWTEHQLLKDRRIIARFDLESQVRTFLDKYPNG